MYFILCINLYLNHFRFSVDRGKELEIKIRDIFHQNSVLILLSCIRTTGRDHQHAECAKCQDGEISHRSKMLSWISVITGDTLILTVFVYMLYKNMSRHQYEQISIFS